MKARFRGLSRAIEQSERRPISVETSPGGPMLSIQNLSHIYAGGKRALNGVSLDIPPGMFGLLGPNGAGKSTLMRCIATLQTPSGGSIRFGDIDVVSEPD